MRKIVCIFPQDKSTDFLLPIYEQLERLPDFRGYRFDTIVSPQTKDLYDSTNFEKGSFLIFLGHGASNKLYGSVDEKGQKQELFNWGNIDHIRNLDFVCIACRSKEFANKHFQRYIGFGNIISDFSEITAERDTSDPNFLEWATEEDIYNFQNLFVQAVAKAVLLPHSKDIQSLYKMMKLCFNKQIAELLKNKRLPNYRHLADMLFEVLDEMECSLNNN